MSAEHLKDSSNRIVPMCFTGFFIHGMLPPTVDDICGFFVPIVKDKRASVCSTSNYRPIALASIMSKLLEKIILNRIYHNLVTNPNQFGFKPKHNTEMCIFALKEAILKCRALNSNRPVTSFHQRGVRFSTNKA